MEAFEAINKRRSIRKFSNKEIPKEIIEKILESAMQAPSSKNRQPWKFVVVSNKEKDCMLAAMKEGIENEKNNKGILPNAVAFIGSAKHTMRVMEQAPVTIFVFNSEAGNLWNDNATVEGKLFDISNVQSIGAAIQNMLLAATELGIGSLWICDVFFAYRELCRWLQEEHELIAAISFGYPEESPQERPRKALADVVEWR